MKRILFLLALLLFCGGFLYAEEPSFQLQIDTAKVTALPGFQTAQKLFVPRFVQQIQKNLADKNLSLHVTRISVEVRGEDFEAAFQGISLPQIEYLLKYKMLNPNWQYTAQKLENGSLRFDISDSGCAELPDAVYLTSLAEKNILVFSSKPDIAFKDFAPITHAVEGSAMFDRTKVAHISMKDVSRLDFSVRAGKNKAKQPRLCADIRVRGDTPDENAGIAQNLTSFFNAVYTNAASAGQLREDHKEAFRVARGKDGVAVIQIRLSEALANDFCVILSRIFEGKSVTE